MRTLTAEEIDWISEGAAVLGAGGGGSTYLASLALKRLLRNGASVQVATVDEIGAEAVGPVLSGMGAPTVGIERLPTEGRYRALVEAVGSTLKTPAEFVAIGEIGGGNAITPLVAAAEAGLPVVDADPMGRAFPELQMDTYMIEGLKPNPLFLHDGKSVVVTMQGIEDPKTAERYARALTWAMGGSAGLVLPVLTGAEVRAHGIAGTLSLTEAIGRAMAEARRQKATTAEAILSVVPAGRHLFEGKIVDVVRRTAAGFARGTITVEGLGAFRGRQLEVEFQNEYLIARDREAGSGSALLTVPDLLVLLEEESGQALGSEAVRYGLRIHVLGLPAAQELKTEQALSFVGPAAFGYEVPFRPIEGDLLGRPDAVGARG